MRKNIAWVVLFELVILIVAIGIICKICGCKVVYLLDLPTILVILLITLPTMAIMGIWKDFFRAFSIGKKTYSLLELKNTVEAISSVQKIIIMTLLIEIVISTISILANINDLSLLGPNLAVAVLGVFYTAIFEILILPLKINTVKILNAAIDMDFEE